MNNKKYNSHEDVRKFHQVMGEICLRRARNPEKCFFMDVQDNERRMRFVKHNIPNAKEILKEYGNDPVIAISGYFVHQAIAHYELIGDMNNYGRANRVRTARNIAYNDELIKKHTQTLENISPDFAKRMLASFKGLEAIN
jgi:hypothetical protein